MSLIIQKLFPGGLLIKNPPANVGGAGLGRSPVEGNGNPFQCSCLGNPMDRGAWWDYRPPSTEELDTTEPLNNNGNNKHTQKGSHLQLQL